MILQHINTDVVAHQRHVNVVAVQKQFVGSKLCPNLGVKPQLRFTIRNNDIVIVPPQKKDCRDVDAKQIQIGYMVF